MSQIDKLKAKIAKLHPLGGGDVDFTVLQCIIKRGEEISQEEANDFRTIIHNQLGPEASVTLFEVNGKAITFHLENFNPEKLMELTQNF